MFGIPNHVYSLENRLELGWRNVDIRSVVVFVEHEQVNSPERIGAVFLEE